MIHRRIYSFAIVLVAGMVLATAVCAVSSQTNGQNVDTPKKIMQINVYQDGTMEVLDALKTKALGKPIKAEQTTWKEFHKYLKEHEVTEAVSEDQLTLFVTNPCCWVKIGNAWFRVCL
jgi:hypothetical protein